MSGFSGELSGWPTPIKNDASGSQYCYGRGAGGKRVKHLKLPGAIEVSGWTTPAARDGNDSVLTEYMMWCQAEYGVPTGPMHLAVWPSGYSVEMERSGQSRRLNPAFYRWLMGYPEGWEGL